MSDYNLTDLNISTEEFLAHSSKPGTRLASVYFPTKKALHFPG